MGERTPFRNCCFEPFEQLLCHAPIRPRSGGTTDRDPERTRERRVCRDAPGGILPSWSAMARERAARDRTEGMVSAMLSRDG